MLNQEQIEMLIDLLDYEEEYFSTESEEDNREEMLELVRSTRDVLKEM